MKYHFMEHFRGLAALWVLSFHYKFSATFQDAFPFAHAVAKYGYLGVPMFFVISGYCITAAARKSGADRDWKTFLFRRMKRIYPAFWMSVLVAASVPFIMEGLSAARTGHYVLPLASASVNNGFLAYGLGDWVSILSLTRVFQHIPGALHLSDKFTTLNAVYWTLALEVQFYLAMTLVVMAGRWFYSLLLGITAAAFVTLSWPHGISMTGIFLPYWPMFSLGILLYWLFETGADPERLPGRLRTPLLTACLLVLAGLFAFSVQRGSKMGFLPFGMSFALCLFLFKGLDKGLFRYCGRHRMLARISVAAAILGEFSYSIYLLHGRILHLTGQVLRQALARDSLLYDFGVLASTLAICYIFHLFCERPFLARRKVRTPAGAFPPAPVPVPVPTAASAPASAPEKAAHA